MKSFSLRKKLLPSAMATALVAGFAFSGSANAIHLAEDGIGQVLLGPWYYAQVGYVTKMSIVNTSTTTAVKAKVVLRSAVASTEVFDFLCYLTPSDVCRFEIRYSSKLDSKGRPMAYFYSDDDSVKSPIPVHADSPYTVPAGTPTVNSLENTNATFASIVPAYYPVFMDRLGTGDTVQMGHIEVIGAYAVKGTVMGYNATGQKTFVEVTPGMSKFSLAQIFDSPRTSAEAIGQESFYRAPARGGALYLDKDENLPTESSERAAESAVPDIVTGYGPLVNSKIRSTDPSWISLIGNAELIGTTGDRTAYRLPALTGAIGDHALLVSTDDEGVAAPTKYGFPVYTNTVWSTTNSGYSQKRYFEPAVIISQNYKIADFDGLVIANPVYDVKAGENAPQSAVGVRFGQRLGVAGTLVAAEYNADKDIEIERALAATNLQQTYENDIAFGGTRETKLLVTFPTRYNHYGRNVCTGGARVSGTTLIYTPPFATDGAITYSMLAYNDFEQSTTILGIPYSGGANVVTVEKLQEVNYFLPAWPNYQQGWYDVSLGVESGCPYPGVPTLSVTHKYDLVSGQLRNSTLVPTSHKPNRNTCLNGNCDYFWMY
ncbi:hypothetical protein [Beggiatoa leptomitoformis]|uniref:IgGFc-binding protein N-terminal domain-containing protein n=1 Tax=Beggiatoa leptomitoformis TaxID=288004 RepID=A0A2N9YH33_9GAMM|nr:hypothetical protein [Beggiatoa leptomitoformis]ALG68171.1 hypothetical protein AL038_11220 [Beggiatoa leptomitoformis]AUI69526.1 hypothetical protein BLE401_13050 [Beggiatoa leptomitoformis]